jgi:hypothetical protein
MLQYGMIGPVLALIGWTFVMWVWMYATRIPAMAKLKIDPQEAARTGEKLKLPPTVTRVADNYNHLHEQPTLFYALALAAHVSVTDSLNVQLAWAYVAIRVIHSILQATVNIITLRFLIFTIGTAVLLAILVRTVLMVLA